MVNTNKDDRKGYVPSGVVFGLAPVLNRGDSLVMEEVFLSIEGVYAISRRVYHMLVVTHA